MGVTPYQLMNRIITRPEPFEFYTADYLWTDPYIAARMLEYHLDSSSDIASRRPETIARAVDWLTARFNLSSGKAVADFGCGPGLYANRLARNGARVTGIDFSESSIDYARKQADTDALAIDYIHQDYLEFTSDRRFDLILMIFCDYCALNPSQRSALRTIFRNHLADGGHIVLDVFTDSFFKSIQERTICEFISDGGFWSARPHYVFDSVITYDDYLLCLNKFTIIESQRVGEVYNWLQCFTPDKISGEFERSKLQVTEIHGTVAGDPLESGSHEMAIVAQASDQSK